jgi:hypothetical protein
MGGILASHEFRGVYVEHLRLHVIQRPVKNCERISRTRPYKGAIPNLLRHGNPHGLPPRGLSWHPTHSGASTGNQAHISRDGAPGGIHVVSNVQIGGQARRRANAVVGRQARYMEQPDSRRRAAALPGRRRQKMPSSQALDSTRSSAAGRRSRCRPRMARYSG